MTVITEKETVKASEIEIPSDAITDGLSELASETEKQPEAEQKSKSRPAPALVPPTEQEPEPTSEPEASHNNSEDMVYVPGFCWMEKESGRMQRGSKQNDKALSNTFVRRCRRR